MGEETLGDPDITIALVVWFVDVDYFIAINVHTQPLDLRCWWRLVQKRVSRRSWTNVARPCFLLKEEPASW